MDFDLKKIESSSLSEQMDFYEVQDKEFRRESFKRGLESRKKQNSGRKNGLRAKMLGIGIFYPGNRGSFKGMKHSEDSKGKIIQIK